MVCLVDHHGGRFHMEVLVCFVTPKEVHVSTATAVFVIVVIVVVIIIILSSV